MSDLFETKNIRPMLIADNVPLFVDDNYLYEIKWDGERCIAYLDPKHGTILRNKRNVEILPIVPELSEIHKQAKEKCIVDGELIILDDGVPRFEAIQRRSLMSNQFKIDLDSKKAPATYVAFDCLYYNGQDISSLPFSERKAILHRVIPHDSERLSISRSYESEHAEALFLQTQKQGLEGIVAKQKDSAYMQDTRTKRWLKIKHLEDDDFVVCGYIHKSKGVISVVLGQYKEDKLVYKGHVTLGVSREAFENIKAVPKSPSPPFEKSIPNSNDNAIWLRPQLVCVVKYMYKTKTGSMRQPVFKGLRLDKSPRECIDN